MAKKKLNGDLAQALIMDKFEEHTRAIGGLIQAISDLRVDVTKIATKAEEAAKAESKKESFRTRMVSVLLAGLISVGIALAF